MKRIIQLKVNGIEFEAILNTARTAQAIWEALPTVARLFTSRVTSIFWVNNTQSL
ncbi:MAG: hypothetical protein IMY88_04205 [Chloroflexi bacterium]|nr:hypothetical protein [Chloroflexota bacterium]